jgi:drug/metabolite transporter (DMT)-like permease
MGGSAGGKPPNRLVGFAFVALAAFGYGLLPIFVKLAYAGGITPTELLIWRFVIAAAFLWVIQGIWRGRPSISVRRLPRRQVMVSIGMGLIFAVVALLTFYTIAAIPVATYTVLLHTYPAIVVLLSFVMGKAIPGREWVAVALAFGGTVLVLEARFSVTQLGDVALPLGMSLSYALYLYLSEKLASGIPGLAFGTVSLTATAGVLLFLLPLAPVSIEHAAQVWLLIAAIAVVSTVIPLIAMFMGIIRLGASTSAIASNIEPVITLVLSILVLGERLTAFQLIGAVVVITSVVMLNTKRQARVTDAV